MKRTILVTGATDGIGKQTAFELALLGAEVWVHGRSREKAERVAAEVGAQGAFTADLASLEQVRALAADVEARAPALDVIVHNAGVFEDRRTLSADGYELTLAVNHLAPFLLTHLLLPVLRANRPSRVVNVSSGVHALREGLDLDDLQREARYDGQSAYAGSKLCNVLFTNELARRLDDPTLSVLALHPGVIATKLLHRGFGGGGAPLEAGARTSVFAATHPSLDGKTALYLRDGTVSDCAPIGRDPALMRELYDRSCRLVGIDGLPG